MAVKPMTKRQRFEDKEKTTTARITMMASNTYPIFVLLILPNCFPPVPQPSNLWALLFFLRLPRSNVKNFSDISGVFECYWFLDGPTNANSRQYSAVVLISANRRQVKERELELENNRDPAHSSGSKLTPWLTIFPRLSPLPFDFYLIMRPFNFIPHPPTAEPLSTVPRQIVTTKTIS